MKLRIYNDEDGTRVAFTCPGCGHNHVLPVVNGASLSDKPVWGWNGSKEKPTLTPSIREMTLDGKGTFCHCNLTDGQVVFHGDSPHAAAGKTLPLPEFRSYFDD